MSTVDISKTIADCEREPIRTPGSIQPHGVLLALLPQDLKVVQIAGDTQAIFGHSQQHLLGRSLRELGGSPALLQLTTQLNTAQFGARPVFVSHLRLQEFTFDVSGHLSEGLLILEFEPRRAPDRPEPMELVQRMASAVRSTVSVAELLHCMASEVQRATGCDRVMIYRFDPDGHGHVAAEKRSGDNIESFLDLHYPGSDIPMQARALYLRNWIRCIPDIDYAPLPIVPADNPLTGRPLDLTFSALRSVSPVHLEYLAQMGVAASMSVSIILGGTLWGLIACHHYAPHFIDCSLRSALELFAQVSSLQLATRLELDRGQRNAARRSIQDASLADLQEVGLSVLRRDAHRLIEVVGAQGMVMRIDGATFSHGHTLDETALATLLQWLDARRLKTILATDRIADLLKADGISLHANGIAGVLAMPLANVRDYAIWFLPELTTTVTWAGNPNESRPNADGRLTPRTSFAAWSEAMAGRSRPWEQDELDAAGRLRFALLEFAFLQIEEAARERESVQKRQELIMAELDHRVKNILATIQSLVRFSSKSAESLSSFTKGLEHRLVSMARAHDLLNSSRWTGASLHRVIAEELAAFCPSGADNLQLSGEDISLTPSAAQSLSLLLHELATNASKYGCLVVPEGRLSIRTERVINDSGISLIRLEWLERNGPAVVKPTRRGFGRLLLETVYEHDVSGGGVSLHFEPLGVRCQIDLPADRIVTNPDQQAVSHNV